jgi:UDP-N-acetylmuramoyl-tripeptide--D-alanyl-D-alanine ligase
VAVIEMGMNHAGEIAALARIAEPDWAVVSNVGMAHAEFFADGIAGVARAKYELVEALPGRGIAFLNADDERVRSFANGLGPRASLYGTVKQATVMAANIKDRGLAGTAFTVKLHQDGGKYPIVLKLPGRHNVLNALAAIDVGLTSGIAVMECVAALEQMRPTEKRGNVLSWRGAEIVNDTYNANPAAMLSMIEALKNTGSQEAGAQRRILIAGEMLELGAEAARLHRECGEAAAEAGIDVVVGVRGLAKEMVEAAQAKGVAAEFVESADAAGAWMQANVRPGDVVLLKGSRGVRLERALEALV